jgi:YbgC/YbaW family acyl-CoA thioester hydrolase
MMSKYIFETKMEVRDYECDIEGIVNNANYLHYMEHTRHLFLKECGLSFAEMHNKGVDAVVARMNLQYKVLLVNLVIALGSEFSIRKRLLWANRITKINYTLNFEI